MLIHRIISKSQPPNHALQRTRPSRHCCNLGVPRAGGAELGSFNHLILFLSMTLLKRIGTSIVLFVFFFVVMYFVICIVGGAISGAAASAGSSNPQAGYEAARQAGGDFVRHHILAIVLGSFVFSLASSLGLSFSGILPWCRKPAQPEQS